jgi:hypothetical protein
MQSTPSSSAAVRTAWRPRSRSPGQGTRSPSSRPRRRSAVGPGPPSSRFRASSTTSAAIYPFGRVSPFVAAAGLEGHGLRWIEPPASLGHPLDDGTAVIVERDVEATAAGLGRDRDAYRRLFGPLVRDFDALLPDALAPFHVPLSRRRAIRLGLFGLNALQSATSLSKRFGERWKRLPAPRPRWPLAGYRSGPSSSSPSRASSIDRERPRAGTRSGRIATS